MYQVIVFGIGTKKYANTNDFIYVGCFCCMVRIYQDAEGVSGGRKYLLGLKLRVIFYNVIAGESPRERKESLSRFWR